jgi:short-subunit dehydrogenase involved in D-alanine esterification of teichoic acids
MTRMTGIPNAVVVGVGAEQGLGAALSGRFAAEGHRVLVSGRAAVRLNQVVAHQRIKTAASESIA